MFQPNEADANGASNVPPAHSSQPQPRQERLHHVLYGSLDAIDTTIKKLHAHNYADPGDWSDPIPVPLKAAGAAHPSEQWMAILTKILLIE